MKRKISLSFALLFIYFVLTFSNLIGLFRGIPLLLRTFSVRGLIGFLVNAIDVLTIPGILVLIYFNTKKDVKKIAFPGLLVAGIVKLYAVYPKVRSFIAGLGAGVNFISQMPQFAQIVFTLVTGLLLILGAVGVKKGVQVKASYVLAILGGAVYFMFTAALFLSGMGSIMQLVQMLLLYIGLCALPKTLVNHDTSTMLNGTSLKALVALAVVIVIIIVIAGGQVSSGHSGRTCAMSGCNRSVPYSGDTVYCTTHSSRCLNCGCYVDADAMFCMDCLSNALR